MLESSMRRGDASIIAYLVLVALTVATSVFFSEFLVTQIRRQMVTSEIINVDAKITVVNKTSPVLGNYSAVYMDASIICHGYACSDYRLERLDIYVVYYDMGSKVVIGRGYYLLSSPPYSYSYSYNLTLKKGVISFSEMFPVNITNRTVFFVLMAFRVRHTTSGMLHDFFVSREVTPIVPVQVW